MCDFYSADSAMLTVTVLNCSVLFLSPVIRVIIVLAVVIGFIILIVIVLLYVWYKKRNSPSPSDTDGMLAS